jgi:CDP-diacylglycerol--glycerol-3-phosphate 3-phosphatidyltransferase
VIGRLWPHLPNIISSARLAATPVLLWAIVTRRVDLFTWLLLACLLSDIADGLIARTFRLRSELGALLDSTADMIVMLMSLAGVWRFQRAFLAEQGATLLALLALYVFEVIVSLWRYGRISSFHTVLTRIAAYSQGIFVMSLFLWGFQPWLFLPMVALTVLSLSEELVLLYLLPTWTTDVRGLYWLQSRS